MALPAAAAPMNGGLVMGTQPIIRN